MGKITQNQFNKYKAINENGFKVNVGKLLYSYSSPVYPEMTIEIMRDEKILIDLTVSFYKFNAGKGQYRIEASENKIEGNMLISGTGYFSKTYYKEETDNKTRFNFKHIKELCHKFNIEELSKEILKDYALGNKLKPLSLW